MGFMMWWNPDQADRVINDFYYRHQERIQHRYSDWIEDRQQEQRRGTPTQLEHKTKLFSYDNRRVDSREESKADDTSEDDEDSATTCPICFASILEGDRVGDLPCRHIFHVSCLKGWLIKRNVWPLLYETK
jgi:hypothetical protein